MQSDKAFPALRQQKTSLPRPPAGRWTAWQNRGWRASRRAHFPQRPHARTASRSLGLGMPRAPRPLTRVLRRWAKLARTTRKKNASSATIAGGWDRTVRCSTAEVTLGWGIKQLGGTSKRISGWAWYWQKHRERAVVRRARRGADPLGDLLLHHHRDRSKHLASSSAARMSEVI